MPVPDPLKSYRLYLAMFLLNVAVVLGVIYLLRRDPPRPIVVTEPPVRPATRIPNKSATAPVPTQAPNTPAVNNLSAPTAHVETPDAPVTTKINLNTATAAELDALPGIGPALAQRILDYRAQIGGFTSIEQLIDVRGIGDILFNDLKELVTVP